MNPVAACAPYEAAVRRRLCLQTPDGQSAFKVYLIDIVGRKDRERFEWDACAIDTGRFAEALGRTEGVEGVGFVTTFPHITKVFRFGPEKETVLNVRAWNTADLAPIDLSRSDGYVEFACLAEAIIAADEYVFWGRSATVKQYLESWSDWQGGAVAAAGKLRSYWEQA